jgi:hypothetical protein
MTAFLLRRLGTFAATLVVASAVVFAVLELLPGNAAEVILGDTATPESLAALESKLGLDRPRCSATREWVGGLLQRRERATSISYDTPTAELIAERLQVTLPLAADGDERSRCSALAAGVYAASRHNRLGDVGVMAASQIGIAIPNFWFAILLILLFAVKLQWVRCRRLSGLARRRRRRPVGRPEGAAAAGAVAGDGAGRDPGARDALGRARGDARGLRAHRARQGPVAPPGAVAPRAAQRDDPGAHDHGPAVRQPDHRHGHGRERVRAARHGPLVFQAISQPRPGGGARRGDAAGRDGGARELRGRRALRGDRPAPADA